VDDVFSAVVCDGKQFGFLVDDLPQGQLALDQALTRRPSSGSSGGRSTTHRAADSCSSPGLTASAQ
jgi:hypothetical protein